MTTVFGGLTDGDEGLFGGVAGLVDQMEGGGGDAESDALAGTVEAHQLVLLVEGDGEVLQGAGAKVGQGKGGVDFDPRLIERNVAELNIAGELCHLDLETGGERFSIGEEGRFGREPEVRDKPFREA